MEADILTEMPVTNYKSTSRNILAEWIFNLNRDGSLKSRIQYLYLSN